MRARRAVSRIDFASGWFELCSASAAACRSAAPLDALRGHEPAHRELAGGDRAGLVHDDGVDLGRRLERAGLLDHDAEPRRRRERRDHRGRIGDEERARAGDDEHGDRPLRRGVAHRRVGAAAREEPDDEGHHQHDRHVVGREALDHLLPPRARTLRLADQPLDLADRGLPGDRGHLEVDLPGEVRGAGVGLRARLHLDRNRFAGERGLIDVRGARDDPAVGGQVLARTHPHDLPDPQGALRDLALGAVGVDEPRDVGGQFDQVADRPLRAPRGAGEDEFRKPQEEREKARGEEVVVGERCKHREAGERIARGGAGLQFLPRPAGERQHEDDRADRRGDLGDRLLEADQARDPRAEEQHAAAQGDHELAFEALATAAFVASEPCAVGVGVRRGKGGVERSGIGHGRQLLRERDLLGDAED